MKRLICLFVLLFSGVASAADPRPNILLVMTDDQGFGDFGAHNNPILKTPNLNEFAKTGIWMNNFYVSPVCSPTRSSLMTGQYNYRTGVVDTYIGRSMMRPDVPTVAEALVKNGYRTGLFGKWHLGDCYPMRPEDRGFQETLWHHGGGLSQPSDVPGTNDATSYFDPTLVKKTKEVKTKGYCSDVFSNAAMEFMSQKSDQPFFAYVAYNAPHGPFQVPDAAAKPYRELKLGVDQFPTIGQPWANKKLNTAQIANAYGMIANIDDNFGKMIATLKKTNQLENTLIIFMTDNGPGGVRYNSGLRARKGTVYEGGIRVPCYIQWAKQFPKPGVVEQPTAHIDITPTILDAAGVSAKGMSFDGRSFLPLLKAPTSPWAERNLFFQWHRGDVPERYRAFAVRGPQYKLVQSSNGKEKFELFDVEADPYETKDLAATKTEEVEKLKKAYDSWFTDVTKLGFAPPKIILGSDKAPMVRLTRQDWRGPDAGWTPTSIGHWQVEFESAGMYEFVIRKKGKFTKLNMKFKDFEMGMASVKSFEDVATITYGREIPKGPTQLEVMVEANGKTVGVDYVEIRKVK